MCRNGRGAACGYSSPGRRWISLLGHETRGVCRNGRAAARARSPLRHARTTAAVAHSPKPEQPTRPMDEDDGIVLSDVEASPQRPLGRKRKRPAPSSSLVHLLLVGIDKEIQPSTCADFIRAFHEPDGNGPEALGVVQAGWSKSPPRSGQVEHMQAAACYHRRPFQHFVYYVARMVHSFPDPVPLAEEPDQNSKLGIAAAMPEWIGGLPPVVCKVWKPLARAILQQQLRIVH